VSAAAVDASAAGFDALVAEHERSVLRITRAVLRDEHLGSDAAQETFVRLWRRMGETGAPERPGAWLRRAALSSALDLARRREARVHRETSTADPENALAQSDAHPLARVSEAELRQRLERALADLPEGQRAVFALRHDAGLELREVAEVLGVHLSTVKTQFARACLSLQARLSAFRDDVASNQP
jgi:RNA polymerase sigma factor (sigma-70 family)